jgi:LPS sulfotransferase NodH
MTEASSTRSAWLGRDRPTPAQLRGAAYDVESVEPPRRRLLVCAAPRTSSKRLARLLLGAGFGVPMEYFNANSFDALLSRWGIGKAGYLAALYRRRTANGVFATNLQYHQVRDWPHAEQFDDLFADATVIYIVRGDATAQAASLAACLLTGNWGFEPGAVAPRFAEKQLRAAVSRALAIMSAEDQGWRSLFAGHRISPWVITSESVNRDDLAVVNEVSARLGVAPDLDGAQAMLRRDESKYEVDLDLKARLRVLIEREQAVSQPQPGVLA